MLWIGVYGHLDSGSLGYIETFLFYWSCLKKKRTNNAQVNLDGNVREKFMCPPSLLTQGSRE